LCGVEQSLASSHQWKSLQCSSSSATRQCIRSTQKEKKLPPARAVWSSCSCRALCACCTAGYDRDCTGSPVLVNRLDTALHITVLHHGLYVPMSGQFPSGGGWHRLPALELSRGGGGGRTAGGPGTAEGTRTRSSKAQRGGRRERRCKRDADKACPLLALGLRLEGRERKERAARAVCIWGRGRLLRAPHDTNGVFCVLCFGFISRFIYVRSTRAPTDGPSLTWWAVR
jgi:hypothetical protein